MNSEFLRKFALVLTVGMMGTSAYAQAPAPTVQAQAPQAPQQAGPVVVVPPLKSAAQAPMTPAQISAATPAANQVPLDNIKPVDNQAIMDGLADAATEAQTNEEDKARKLAFNAALNGLFPMRPEEIEALIEKLHANERAIVGPAVGNPKAEVKVETISLEPGSQPKEIQTDVGFVTTLSILDATGSPWPILDIGVGGNFDVPAPEEGGNVLRLTPLAKYAVGNISIRLVGLNTPLTFKLRATTGTIYYLYDARIPKLGPKATAPLIDHGNDMVAGDNVMMSFLDGVPPIDSLRLPITGADQRTAAWRVGTKVYLRTPLALLSPGWEGSVGAGDGTHVYLIPDTPVLLLSDNGNLIHARIGNNSKPDEQPVPAIEDGKAHQLRLSAAVQGQVDDGELITRPSSGNEQIISSPTASRTLIRPVAARSATPAPAVSNGPAAAPAPSTQNQSGQ